MAKRVALYTFGIFQRPSADPGNAGFHARNDINLAAVELSAGFIARSGYAGDPGPESWGMQVYPRFYVERGDGYSPSTLSLWQNLAAPLAFTYGGIHAEALARGREWFLKPSPPPQKPAWPPYVLWWVNHDHVPDWQEAVLRHEYLHDHGPTDHAFDWKTPFDENGQPAEIDRTAVQRMTASNLAGQKILKLGENGAQGRS